MLLRSQIFVARHLSGLNGIMMLQVVVPVVMSLSPNINYKSFNLLIFFITLRKLTQLDNIFVVLLLCLLPVL
jgi:hypothetical protein